MFFLHSSIQVVDEKSHGLIYSSFLKGWGDELIDIGDVVGLTRYYLSGKICCYVEFVRRVLQKWKKNDNQ